MGPLIDPRHTLSAYFIVYAALGTLVLFTEYKKVYLLISGYCGYLQVLMGHYVAVDAPNRPCRS